MGHKRRENVKLKFWLGIATNAVSLEHRAMENFKGGWPDSFYCPLGKLDVSMDVKKNLMLVGRNVSMTRNSSRHLSLVYLQDHERSTSMMCWPLSYLHIHHWCSMNMEKWMSTQKHKPQVTISECNCPISDTRIYDVSALLWVITWPSGKLRVYVDAIKLYDAQMSSFDKSIPNSIKTFTRTQRSGSRRFYKVTPDMQAPAKQVVLTNTKNKIQLNAMIADGILISQPMLLHRSNTDAHPYDCRCPRCASWDNRWSEDWPTRSLLHTPGGWYPNRTTRHLVFTLRQVCSCCVRRQRRVCPTRSLLQ